MRALVPHGFPGRCCTAALRRTHGRSEAAQTRPHRLLLFKGASRVACARPRWRAASLVARSVARVAPVMRASARSSNAARARTCASGFAPPLRPDSRPRGGRVPNVPLERASRMHARCCAPAGHVPLRPAALHSASGAGSADLSSRATLHRKRRYSGTACCRRARAHTRRHVCVLCSQLQVEPFVIVTAAAACTATPRYRCALCVSVYRDFARRQCTRAGVQTCRGCHRETVCHMPTFRALTARTCSRLEHLRGAAATCGRQQSSPSRPRALLACPELCACTSPVQPHSLLRVTMIRA